MSAKEKTKKEDAVLKDDQEVTEDEVLEEKQEDLEADAGEEEDGEEVPALDYSCEIEEINTCGRRIKITIPQQEVTDAFDAELDQVSSEAVVRGFRVGHAPKKIVAKQYRKEVGEKVKSALLMTVFDQVTEDHNLAPISEPEADLAALNIDPDSDFVFEFTIEVRPDFDLPDWKGLELTRPEREFSADDVDGMVTLILEERGKLVTKEDAAAMRDYITTNVTITAGEKELSSQDGEVIRVMPKLSFQDGEIEDFGKQMVGVASGDTKELKFTLSDDVPNEELKGAEVTAKFEVIDVKSLESPGLSADLIEELSRGEVENEADFRDLILKQLQRQLEHEQRSIVREQITEELIKSASWDLPQKLLEGQAEREVSRRVLELRSSNFSEQQILAYENQIRQNIYQITAKSLKEHFILEKIADIQNIEASQEELTQEVMMIAMQSGDSPRRIMAHLEKTGQLDLLTNQVIERKVIDLILEFADFKGTPYEMPELDTVALSKMASGVVEIPQATDEEEDVKEEE